MPNNLGFFAINADDVTRAREFYTAVFGWTFEPWGPPGFFLIKTEPGPRHVGGLQERRELAPGEKTIGWECTVNVDDIDATIRAIEASGGKMITQKFVIPNQVTVAYFQDTEGNVAAVSEPIKK